MGKKKRKKDSNKANNKSIDMNFALNEKRFRNDFSPLYKARAINPKFLVQFPVLLPFHIPFENGTCVTFQLENEEACTFHFSDIQTFENITAGIVNTKAQRILIRKSRIEMTLVTKKELIEIKEENYLSKTFDLLLRHLNYIILSYQVFFASRKYREMQRKIQNVASPLFNLRSC